MTDPNPWTVSFEDAAHLLPGFPKFDSARLAESRLVTMEKVYQITPAEFVPLIMALPKKGRVHLVETGGVWCWFRIESVQVERLGSILPSAIAGNESLRANTFLVRAELKMELLRQNSGPGSPPWDLPCYRFRVTPAPLRATVRTFYPTAGDPLLGTGAAASAAPMPLVSTAGLPLSAESSRVLTRFSFCYNLEATGANYTSALDWSWIWPGHTNALPVLFAGIEFPPLTLLFESFSFEVCGEPYSYTAVIDGAQTEVSGTWRYLKCAVRLLADPLTFARNYLNIGVHRRTASGLERLWQWQDDAGRTVYGTYADALARTAAQEVTENLFLNADGTGVSAPGADGRPVPTYRRGVLEQPLDFNLLGLPAEPPVSG